MQEFEHFLESTVEFPYGDVTAKVGPVYLSSFIFLSYLCKIRLYTTSAVVHVGYEILRQQETSHVCVDMSRRTCGCIARICASRLVQFRLSREHALEPNVGAAQLNAHVQCIVANVPQDNEERCLPRGMDHPLHGCHEAHEKGKVEDTHVVASSPCIVLGAHGIDIVQHGKDEGREEDECNLANHIVRAQDPGQDAMIEFFKNGYQESGFQVHASRI